MNIQTSNRAPRRNRLRRVLVTGGAGFIGSHFIKFALRRHPHWYIVNLDKLTYAGNLENLADLPDPRRHTFVRGDIADEELVTRLWRGGFDFVINFAAATHVDRSLRDPDEFYRTNTKGVWILLEAARQWGVRRFLQISTDEVYGSIRRGSFSEQSRPAPGNDYAMSKAGGDMWALAYYRTYRVPVIVTRCTNNFGPHQHPEKFIPLCITNALEDRPLPLYGDGRQVRDWIYVEDHCAAVDLLLRRGAPGQIYNIAGGQPRQNLAVARSIVRRLGKPESLIEFVRDRPGHDRRYSLDASKLTALGWQPRHKFATALAATIDWYATHVAWWRKIKRGAFRAYYARQYGRQRTARSKRRTSAK